MITKEKKHDGVSSRERGSALLYILIAIALLAVLTSTFMNSSSDQTTAQNTVNMVTELRSQANFIRSAIDECILTYPEGAADAIGTLNVPYPINPSSAYFTGSTLGIAPDDGVKYLRCAGNPGVNNNQERIFAGASGKFLPPSPKLFSEWYYYNGQDGVFFIIGSDKTDAYITESLKKLDDQFSECEADVITGGVTGVYTTRDNQATLGKACPASHLCFRVWMVAKPGAIYPGDSDNDETGICP